MPYLIATDYTKNSGTPHGFYSHVHGCFSRKDQAMRFGTFEAAQPKVRELRAAAPDYFFAAVAAS